MTSIDNQLVDPGWHRLHPLSPVVRTARHAAGLFALVVLAFTSRVTNSSDVIFDSAFVGVALVAGLVTWLVTRWRVADNTLQIESGLIRRRSQRLPLGQVQAIDVVQTAVARAFGLAELRLRMAGASSSGGRLACLPLAPARELRAELLAMAHTLSGGAEPIAPGMPPPPEIMLFQLTSGRLVATTFLGRSGGLIVSGFAAVAVGLQFSRGGLLVVLGVFAVVFGLLIGWKRMVSDYSLSVYQTDRGFRMRSGLLQTSEETIRPGRIQAIRMIQPLVWRPMGWCRLDVDVAGKHSRRENEAQRGRLRSVMPVGSKAEAQMMLDRLMPGLPQTALPPPPRARWKSPFSFHNLAWGGDDQIVVATDGRLRRETNWVPLAKVQSVRWLQGPVQRRLHLATIRLDTAGRSIHTALKDRELDEAEAQMRRLPELCHVARRNEN